NLRLIHELWTQEVVSFEGRYCRFQDMQTSPRPVQQPRPPIWVGGNSRRALRRVAELGDGWHSTGITPAAVAEGRERLQQLWESRGRSGSPLLSIRIALFLEGASREVLSYPPRGVRAQVRGSVQQVVETIGQYKEAGIEHMVFEMSTQAHANILQTMETFMSRVRPQV
ncbi:MAG: LLM class flavin-dependent oxidoreductase, partial [Nitrospinota bacterium]